MGGTEPGAALRRLNRELSRLPAKELGQELYRRTKEDDITTLAAAFPYPWVFALPPLLILTVMVAALLNQATALPIVAELRELVVEAWRMCVPKKVSALVP